MASPFPFLLPMNVQRTLYIGYVGPSSKRDRFEFKLKLKNPEDLSSAKVHCSSAFTEMLGSTGLSVLQQRLKSSPSIASFLIELDNLIERAERERNELSDKVTVSSVASAEVCSRLVTELDGLRSQLVWIHPSLGSLKL